jgi:long-subunit acyl-CoA synthetase (AMP-forming)
MVRVTSQSQAKQAIGLDKCKFFLTGAAPISTQTLEYFASIGININEVTLISLSQSGQNITTTCDPFVPAIFSSPLQVYGMSECCGATTIR